ncbi:MAG: DNA double-strand break repair nuclease NurA [Anaerolineaceae bacterium]|nr:DNA double-strand break repair nuclease NurA [Anaerolineaceae bacterium]
MPINYLNIREQVQQMGVQYSLIHQDDQSNLTEARELLLSQANQLEKLKNLVEEAAREHPYLRCAAPFEDPLTMVYDEPETDEEQVLILASDGSQINPDRHDPVEFGLVNVGIFQLISSSKLIPEIWSHSKLFYDGMIGNELGNLNEESIALARDTKERGFLSEKAVEQQRKLASEFNGELLPVIALTDGPLEIFGEPRSVRNYQIFLKEYLLSLDKIADIGAVIGGYVDKPRADLVVRMLELSLMTDSELSKRELPRIFERITDAALFSIILAPGQRTGVFKLISRGAKQFADPPHLGLHFFYLNVGMVQRDGTPLNLFARVEIPQWVAADHEKIDRLHSTLIQQCRILGNQPYPYVLHRAHEIATVRYEEHDDLLRMITTELLNHGIQLSSGSQKSENKSSMRSRRSY